MHFLAKTFHNIHKFFSFRILLSHPISESIYEDREYTSTTWPKPLERKPQEINTNAVEPGGNGRPPI